MSERSVGTEGAGGKSRRGAALIAAGVAVVAVVAVVWTLASGGGTNSADGGRPPTGTDRRGAAGTPTATSTPTLIGQPPPVESSAPVAATGSAGPGGRVTAKAKPLRATARVGQQIEASLSSIRHVTGKAEIPGEVGGPALDITVRVANRATAAFDLSAAVVNVFYGTSSTPSSPFDSAAHPLPVSVPGHRAVTGTYQFEVPKSAQGRIRVELDFGVGFRVAAFAGSARG